MAEIDSLTVKVTAEGVKKTAEELNALAEKAGKAEVAVGKTGQKMSEADKQAQKLAEQTQKLAEKFKLQAASVGKSADEIAILKLEQSGATKAQVDAAKAALEYKRETISAAKATKEAAEAATKAEASALAARKQAEEQAQAISKQAQKEAAALKAKTDNLVGALEFEARAAGMTADEIKIMKLESRGASKEQIKAAQAAIDYKNSLKQVGNQAGKTAGQTEKSAAAAKELRGGFRAMRGSTQQVSYQLQDIAVQAQMGTSAFTILGQQGPQLASVFGPGGAVLGAFVAFGAIIGGFVYNHLTGTTKEMEALEEAANELTDDITRLTAAEQAYQRILVTENIDAQKESLANLQKELAGASREFKLLTDSTGLDTLRVYTETQEEFAKRTALLGSQISKSKEKITELEGTIDSTSNTTEDLIEGLREEAAALGKTQRQLDLATTATGLAGEANRKLINDYHDQIDAQKKNEAATKAKIDADAAAVTKLEAFNASVDSQRQLLELTGDALYLYQAQQAGATGADAQALAEKLRFNAELRETIRLKKEADAQAKRDEAQAEADKKKAAADAKAQQGRIKTIRLAAAERLDVALRTNDSEIENLQDALKKKLAILEEDRLTMVLAAEANGEDTLAVELTYADAKRELARGTAAAITEIERAEAEKRANEQAAIQQMALSRASAVAGQLAGVMNQAYGEQSAAAKAAFLLQQGLAMAQIVVATQQAAALAGAYAAGAGPLAWLASVHGIQAMGAAQLAIVAGQTVAGLARATGGQVRGGESYLVGERGPELLTMGGSGRISSNDQLKNAIGGGEGITIVNNVDARGADASVDVKIRKAMQQTAATTIETIRDLSRRRRFI